MAVRTGKGKADKGTSTSIREGVRLPEQGGGTPERKSPRTPTLRFRERETIGCSGESARRLRRIHPHPRREGAGNSTPAGKHVSGGGTSGYTERKLLSYESGTGNNRVYSGESARRPRKGKTPAGPGESTHNPGGRRGSSGQAGRGQGTAHLPGGTYPAAAQPDTAGKRQKKYHGIICRF